jgi:Mlc titration factor MtfA (ptsG expression regulator)
MIRAWQRWREARTLARRAIPEPLWRATLQAYPFLGWRSSADQQRLRELSTLFLADKEWAGAQGLAVTDAMAVAIAAQACVPVLRLGLGGYAGFKGIVVQPDVVSARRSHIDEVGVVHEYDEELAGEAMYRGPVMLSWTDVERAADAQGVAYNVVIHEFAHVLDMLDGEADGVPPMADSRERAHWMQVIEAQWQRFVRRVDSGEATLIDPYGAQDRSEFFAVASEAFFVAPIEFAAEEPILHELLQRFYRQDPAASFAEHQNENGA